MVEQELLDILVCPDSKQPVRRADEAALARLNSGIEAVVDRFGGELHELSGRAKDVGSAAVLLALLNVIVVWSLVLFT